MTMSARALVLTLLSAAFLFSGCVSIERSYPDKRYFVLDVAASTSAPSPADKGVLQMVSARVSPRYADRNFVYRRSDTRFESDFYNQFLVSPSALVTEELRYQMARAGLFKFVVGSTNALAPTHTMETIVNALYGDFRDLRAPKAVIEIEFFLSQETSPSSIVFHKLYEKVVPVQERHPEALVQGWNQALQGISNSLLSDLKASQLSFENH